MHLNVLARKCSSFPYDLISVHFVVVVVGRSVCVANNIVHGKKCREKVRDRRKKWKKNLFRCCFFFVITYFSLNHCLLHGISRRVEVSFYILLLLFFSFFRQYGKLFMILKYGRNYSIQLFRWTIFGLPLPNICVWRTRYRTPCARAITHNNVPVSLSSL